MTHLSLTYLGSFQAGLAGEPITSFRSSKVEGLLVYLALTCPRVHQREVLGAFLWPNEPDSVAKKNLRQSLYQLRRLIDGSGSEPEPHFMVTRTTCQFNPNSDHTLDVTEFLASLDALQLEKATDLYQGDLLPGFSCDSRSFDEWLQRERQRLQQLALNALGNLTDQSLARADYQDARNLAQQQLTLEPWREEAHRQLIQALALDGERSAALAQYEICRATLSDELGVEPSSETETLVARIRDQDSERGSRQDHKFVPPRRRFEMAFVGRASEYATLVRAYERAAEEGPQFVALIGEAGIGKTRLAEQFLVWASARGADALRGRAFETSGGLSYQPITQALRQRFDQVNAPEDLLSDLWLSQLTLILPELRDRYPDLPEPSYGESTSQQYLFEAITRAFQSLAERVPVVLFLDDWHWADAASLDLLHYAALGWSDASTPILVVLTVRQEAFAERRELWNWLNRLDHDVASYQLNLGNLSKPEIRKLLRSTVDEANRGNRPQLADERASEPIERLAKRLMDETEGQPFFLMETFSVLVEEGVLQPDPATNLWHVNWQALDEWNNRPSAHISPGLRDRMEAWLSRLGDPARDILAAAAVLGEQASFRRVCRVASLEENRALNVLDELSARQLLHEGDGDSASPAKEVVYSFSHQKLSEVVYDAAGAARRRVLHRRAFETLAPGDEADDVVPAAALAHHAFHAGLWEEAIEHAIAAGDEAMQLLAIQVAIPHYEKAMEIVEQRGWPEAISDLRRRDLYAGLGRAHELDQAWDDAQATYLAMVDEARATHASTMECEALNRLATVKINGHNDAQGAIFLLEKARNIAEESGDLRGQAETEWNLSLAARIEMSSAPARHHGEAALAIARQLGDKPLVARCLNSLAYVHARMRDWGSVGSYAGEARELYAAAGNRILEADSQRLAGWSHLYNGQPEQSAAMLRDTYAFSQEIDNLWGRAESAWRLAGALLETGHYGDALRIAEQGASDARMVGQPVMVELALSTLGTVQRTIMALESAQETLSEVVSEIREADRAGYGDWAMGELCAVFVTAGDWEQANAMAKDALEFRQENNAIPMGLTGWYEIQALLRVDESLARAEIKRLSDSITDRKRERLALHRSQAVVAQWDKDTDRAKAHLQSAALLAKEIGIPGEEWSILGELGDLLQLEDDHAAALRVRSRAAEIILRLAASIHEDDQRRRYLGAGSVQSILQATESR